jgi:E3 ubiquitin-protein ligase HUWE1
MVDIDPNAFIRLSGCPDIDIEDLRRNTTYTGYQPHDPTIHAFWKVLHSFSKEEQALFVQFVTGSSKVPLDGFKALQASSPSKPYLLQLLRSYLTGAIWSTVI